MAAVAELAHADILPDALLAPDPVQSEGFEEKYRAVINGGHPEDEQVGQRWGKVEPALWGRRRYSFIHRTKVFADGTIRKIHA